MLLFIFIYSLLVSFFGAPAHEFHTSLAQVHYNKSSQSFEITLRVFTDDLEAALTLLNENKRVTIDDPQLADKLVEQYLNTNFIMFDKQKQKKPMSFIGKEVEVDVTWIYAEIAMQENPNGMQLQNSVLTELFTDQVNIVNFKYLNTVRTFMFKPKETLQSLGI